MSAFDPTPLRAQFPALSQVFNGKTAVFFDNPGGTQVSQRVIEAVSRYYREQNANVGGPFETSRRTDIVVSSARQAMADLLNAPGPENIVFGPNMTSLTFHLARSFGDTIKPGDEIVITDLDHDANVSPWTDLQAAGAVVRVVGINSDCTVNMSEMESVLNERTRLVAITHASNAVGTIPDVQAMVRMAHKAGALVFVDAVQYAPHGPIDVQALDCDFLACSAYKFFGPHVGILYGKREHLEGLRPHKVRPAKDVIPYRWETGTLNHEGLAGVAAAVEYLEQIGVEYGASVKDKYAGYTVRRLVLKWAMTAIREYEKGLSFRLLEGLNEIEGLKVYGITDEDRLDERLPTVAFIWGKLSPHATAEYLGKQGICCWNGNYYALRLMEKLGLEAEGGAVRIGLAHYNTLEEIDALINALKAV
jgi:cysteine desulfurase family protein (TIGR01976 family)